MTNKWESNTKTEADIHTLEKHNLSSQQPNTRNTIKLNIGNVNLIPHCHIIKSIHQVSYYHHVI